MTQAKETGKFSRTPMLSDVNSVPHSQLLLPLELNGKPFLIHRSVDISTFLVSESHTVRLPKNPLRWIVSRTPVYRDLQAKQVAYYRDLLSCGHEQVIFDFDNPETGRWRHRCAECAEVATLKKPSASLPGQKKEAA